jgi:hypothetical protein
MRARMAIGVSVLTLVAVALLGGCQVAVTGAAGGVAADQQKADRRAEERAAVGGAVGSLQIQPVVIYHSTLGGTDLGLRVTKGGTLEGLLPVGGQSVQVVGFEGQLYVAASADYWKAQGAPKPDNFANRWTRVDPSDLPADPAAVLTPAGLGARLAKALATADQLAEPVRAKLADSTEVYEVTTRDGVLKVTAAQPYRLVSFDPAMLAPNGKSLGAEMRVEQVSAETIRKFHDDFDTAVGALGTPADSVAQASVTITDNKLDCNGGNGSCTSSVSVDNSVVGGDPKTSTVHIAMTSVVSADGLGTQTCTGDVTTSPNASVTIPCSVKFAVPNRTAQYKVTSMPSATADVLASVDVNAVKQKIQQEFSALGG